MSLSPGAPRCLPPRPITSQRERERDPHLAAPDLGPLRDRPPDEHEHLADGAALEESKGRQVRAKAEEERVRCVAFPLSQDGDGGEAHVRGFFFFLGGEKKRRPSADEKKKKAVEEEKKQSFFFLSLSLFHSFTSALVVSRMTSSSAAEARPSVRLALAEARAMRLVEPTSPSAIKREVSMPAAAAAGVGDDFFVTPVAVAIDRTGGHAAMREDILLPLDGKCRERELLFISLSAYWFWKSKWALLFLSRSTQIVVVAILSVSL